MTFRNRSALYRVDLHRPRTVAVFGMMPAHQ